MNFKQYVEGNALTISGGWKIVSVDIKELVRYLKSHSGITELCLQCIRIDGEGIGELAKLAHLTSLDLRSSYIGTKGAKALASGNLTNLTSLCLSKSGIDDEGVKELANGNLSNLTSLDLSSRKKIDEEERMYMAINPFDMYSNCISDKGAKELANGNLSNLISLDLRNNEVGAEGAKELVKLKNLTELYLGGDTYRYERDANICKKNVEMILYGSSNFILAEKVYLVEKLKQENLSEIRELESRYQAELTKLREENDNVKRKLAESQDEITRLRDQLTQLTNKSEQPQVAADDQLSSMLEESLSFVVISKSQCRE